MAQELQFQNYVILDRNKTNKNNMKTTKEFQNYVILDRNKTF